MARMRAFFAAEMGGETYRRFMDAGFRRSGDFIYQPICAGCRACQSIRVPVDRFSLSKSQRRCARRNANLSVTVGAPQISNEKFALYAQYKARWHGKDDATFDELESFLYESPVETIEFAYREGGGRLLAVGICDLSPRSLSSVYFYFDPSESRRGLGTFGALREIDFARQRKIPHYYLGYFVAGCAAMEYKASFRPNEILCSDGIWRESSGIAR